MVPVVHWVGKTLARALDLYGRALAVWQLGGAIVVATVISPVLQPSLMASLSVASGDAVFGRVSARSADVWTPCVVVIGSNGTRR